MRDGHGLIGVKPEPKMTLRDQFAMATLTGELAACSSNENPVDIIFLSKWCYRVADAMLKAREEKPQ